MSRVGITGHQDLTPTVAEFVAGQLRRVLGAHEKLIGITSLAVGADQLFARTVLALGGTLEVIVPAATYRATFTSREDLAAYEALLARATITTLPFIEPSEEAFLAAGQEVARRSDSLIAVWDGRPAHGTGGTADIVAYAKSLGVPVLVIWPKGEQREQPGVLDKSA